MLYFNELTLNPEMHSTRSGHAYGSSDRKGKAPMRRTGNEEASTHPDLEHSGEVGQQTLPLSDPRNSSPDDSGDSDVCSDEDDSWNTPSDPLVCAVDWCRELSDHEGNNHYFAFQVATAVVGRVSIRMRSSGECECTCGQPACRHVDWLKNSIGCTDSAPYHQQICAKEFRKLKDEHDWDGEEAAMAESHWQLRKERKQVCSSRESLQERKELVRDLLATFAGNDDVEEYKEDSFEEENYEALINVAIRNLLVPRDLIATISRLLIFDDDFYHRFRSIFPLDFHDSRYLRRLEIKFQRTLKELENYEESGQQTSWTPTGAAPNNFAHDVPWCVRAIIQIVGLVHNFVQTNSLNQALQEQACGILVSILTSVTSQNHELYNNIQWKRSKPYAEPTTERNLFQALLGPTSEQGPSRGNFVLYALEQLPDVDAVKPYSGELMRIAQLLPGPGYNTPRSYVQRLETLVERISGDSRVRASMEVTSGPTFGKRRRMR